MNDPNRPGTGILRLVLALATTAMLLAACTGDAPDPQVPPPLVPAATSPSSPEKVDVVSWGGDGHHLAVVVRNPFEQTIVEADVVIHGIDDAGQVVAAERAEPGAACCSILGLPPGREYGLFAALDRPVDDLAQVKVHLDRSELAAPRPDQQVDIVAVELERTPADAVVVADVLAEGAVGASVVGQAVLADPDDRPIAIISGRFPCFAEGRERRVRMELLRPVPPGTTVTRVMAYPAPRGFTSSADQPCTP